MSTRDDVYREAGRALDVACYMEQDLGTSLLILDALETGSFLNPDADAYTRLRESVDRNTLGKSLNAIRGKLRLPEDLDDAFKKALEARNYLAHRFFPHHGLRIMEHKGRVVMLNDLARIHAILMVNRTHAQSLCEALMAILNSKMTDGR